MLVQHQDPQGFLYWYMVSLHYSLLTQGKTEEPYFGKIIMFNTRWFLMFWVATFHVSVWYIGGISTPRGCLKFERRHRQWILGSILRFWSILIVSDETTRSGTIPQSLDILISALVVVMPFRCRVLPQFYHLISTAVSPPQAKFMRCSAAPSFSAKLFRNQMKQRIPAPDFL